MLRKFVLVVMAMLAATAATLAAPGVALADGTGDFCDTQTGFCISMNGTLGGDVVNKYPAIDNQQDTGVTAYLGCTHAGAASEYVQSTTRSGDTTNCPFDDHSLDADLVGDEIVFIYNVPSGVYVQGRTSTSNLYQGAQGASGELFIKKANSSAYVNVLNSDWHGTEEYMCFAASNGGQVTLFDSQVCSYWTF